MLMYVTSYKINIIISDFFYELYEYNYYELQF